MTFKNVWNNLKSELTDLVDGVDGTRVVAPAVHAIDVVHGAPPAVRARGRPRVLPLHSRRRRAPLAIAPAILSSFFLLFLYL